MAELLGNGGAALLAVQGEGNAKQIVSRSGRRVGGVQAMGGSARMATARGLRGQAAGDGWRHAAVVF